MTEPLLIAKNNRQELGLLQQMANRHGLITGAISSTVGRQIIRGVLGSLLGGRK